MINEQDGQNSPEQIDPAAVDEAIKQAMTDGLRLSYQLSPEEKSMSEGNVGSHEPTPDEVWEYFAANRTKTFDKTTSEGKRLYELFKIANKDRHEFTMETVKQMGNVIARVPVDIVGGLVRNPIKAPLSGVDAVARDIRDLYGILAQSEDPDSAFFRFKDYIKGTGTIEDQIDQFNEARWFNNRSQELEEGKTDIISDWVPADYKGFVKNLIDPKLANALSYIGLDIPHMLLSPLKAGGKVAMKDSVRAYKGTGLIGKIAEEEAQKAAIEGMSSLTTAFRDTYDNTAKRMKEFSMRTTGTVIAGTADVVAKPFSYVQQKIAQGSTALAETSGQNATVLRNAAQTAIADAGERAIGEGLSLSPIRSTIFSLGVKPLTEYASVLGNEIVDLANGVVQVKPQQMGMGMLERLATKNGSRVPLSAEALAVAKFTNVVVGWPASMAMPVLRRSVGDAAFMGTLGYLNSRGEGAAAGVGIGFAWGGLSGSLRHIHSVYSQKSGHAYVISNFDKSQINMIEAKNPETAKHMRATLSAIDGMNDTRIGATIRAAFSQAFTVDPTVQYRFANRGELIKEFGPDPVITSMAETGLGASFKIKKNGGELEVIWINRSEAAPETIVHEIAHLHLNSLLKNDADSVEIYKQFYGDRMDAGIISDDAMAHLIADYRSKFTANPIERKRLYEGHLFMAREKLKSFRSNQGTGSMDNVKTDANGHTIPLAIAEAVDPDGLNYLKEIVDETFVSSYSNSVLNKSPDYFSRNPEYRSLRASLENMYMLRTQRTVAKMEQAGVLLRPNDPSNPNAQLTTFMWEDGKYMHMPILDAWTKGIVAQAMRHGDLNVSLMSPERAEAYFKQTGKERFANTIRGGKVMKGKREIDQIISDNTKRVVDALEALPQNERPRFNISQNGNKSLDMSVLSNKQWDAIINVGVFNVEEVKQLRGLTEMVRNVRAGKPVFNTVTGQYLGRTHQVVIDGQVKRLTGSDVPVTNRHFSPYAIELKFDNFDDFGNPLKEGKGHITVHAVDVRVLNRRRLKMWQRSDVRSLFTDFGHYTRTFADYMDNLSQDASSRKTSAEKFKPEFGSNAEAVRDIMYETFGGRKRADEPYINAPQGGYNGNTDGPNYPFHSLRFELLANLETQPSVFQETFGNNLMALPYNHANAYEGVRRNMMVGGFVEYPIGEDKRYWGNHIGYEIRQNGNRLSLFSPFGSIIGNFKTLARAQSYAERHMRNLPQEEGRGMVGTEQGPTQDSDAEIKVTMQDISSGRANMMVGAKGYFTADVKLKNNEAWDRFVDDAKNDRYNAKDHALDENSFYRQASIKLSEILKDGVESRLLAEYPFIGDFEIVSSQMAVLHGGFVEGVWGSRNGRTILGLSPNLIEALGENAEMSIKTVLQGHLQELISFADGTIKSGRLAYVDGDIRYIGNSAMMSQMKKMKELLDEQKKSNPNATVEDVLKAEASKNIEATIVDYWKTGVNKRGKKTIGQVTSKFNDKALTPEEVSMIESHFWGIINSFSGKDNSSYVIQAMNSTTVFVKPEVLAVTGKLESLLNEPIRAGAKNVPTGASTYRDLYDGLLMKGMSGFHHVTKIGDRVRKDNRSNPNAQLSDIEKASNDYAEKMGVLTSGNANAEGQTLNGIDGIERYAIFTIGRTSDPTEGKISTSVTFVTPATSFTSLSFVNPKAGSRTTTDMQVFPSRYSPMSNLGRRRGGLNVSINSMLAINGLSPFLYGEGGEVLSKGSLHKFVADGTFSNALGYMYAEAFPTKYAELIQKNPEAFSDYTLVKKMAEDAWRSGLSTPQEHAVFHFATAVSQILLGMEMVNQSPIGLQAVDLMSNDLQRTHVKDTEGVKVLQDAQYFSPEYLGAGAVNEGVARIMLIGERMGWGTMGEGSNLSNFVNQRVGEVPPHRYGPVPAKAAEAFVKQIASIGTQLDETLKQAGFDKNAPISPVLKQSNMMVGGFFGSMDANERMMEAAGMLRMVQTDGGQMYKAFEFSDKGSSLLLGAVDEKIHLLPFMNDLDSPTKGFTSFLADYKAAVDAKDVIAMENTVRKLSTIRLDEILKHDQLYRYYPSLKSVRVGFVEGFGAGYYPKQNFIVLGIDRIISGEIARANGVDDVIVPDNVRANSIHSSLLHEIQHAIQRMETWTQTGDMTESAQYKRGIFKYLVKNVMGVGGSFPQPLLDARTKGSDAIKLEAEKAREAGLSDPEIQKALELSTEEFDKHLMELADSPMAQRVFEIAAPSAYQLFGADAMAYERLSYELANSPDDSKRMASYSRDMMALQAEAKVLVDESKNGTFTVEQAHMMLFGDGGLIERRNDIADSISKSFKDKEIANLAYEYTSHHARYLELTLDVGRAMDSIKYSTEHGLGFNSVRMRNLVHSLGLMQYYGQMTEKQAYETSERKNMTQAELNKTKRGEDYLLKTSTDSRANSLRNLGLMMKRGEVPRVSNMMIGGLGKGENVLRANTEDYRLDALDKIARLSTISYYISAADHELQRLNRYVVSARGWEVINGKARLVYKTGIIESPSLKRGEMEKSPSEKYGKRIKQSTMYENTNDGVDTYIHIYNGLSEDGTNSISMDEVARLIDGTVIMENELATTTEAVDAVYRPDFPARLDIDDLGSVLKSLGVSDDGLQMANIGAIQSAFAGATMSKEEIANIMAIHHQFVISEFAYGKAFGNERLTKAINDSSPTPELLSQAIMRTWGKTGGQELRAALERIGVHSNAWIKGDESRTSFGLFSAGRGNIQFTPQRPDFIPEDVWYAWVERKKAEGTWPKDKTYIEIGHEEVYKTFEVYNTTAPSDVQIQRLNKLYAQRCIKIKPIFEKFMQGIDTASQDLKFALIDSAILLNTRYEPESLRSLRVDEFGVRKLWREEIGTQAGRDEHTRIFNQPQFDSDSENTGVTGRFGPSILLGNAFRESGSFKDSSMLGTELILLPTAGHSLDRQINNSYGESNGSFGITMPARSLMTERGMPAYEIVALRDYGYAVNPYSITYGSDITTKGVSRVNADYSLRSIDSAHYGLLKIIQQMQMHYDSNTKDAVGRMKRGETPVEWVEQFSRNAANVSAVMSGLVKSMELITSSLQDRNSLLIPFNTENARQQRIYSPRSSTEKTPVTTIARSRGYLGSDGSLVIESVDENVLNGSTSHTEVLAIPYLAPQTYGQNESTNQALVRLHGVVLSGVVGDLERAFLVNGEIDDPTTGTNIQSGDIHLALNEIIGNGTATPSQIDNIAVTLRSNNYVSYTGVHALHSALYQLVVAKGIEQQALLNALIESPELMDILKRTDFNGEGPVHPTGKSGENTQIDSYLYAVAMVPILTKAFSESTITYKDGKIQKTDILSEGQRQEFKALLAEVNDENLGINQGVTPIGGGGNPQYMERVASFLSSLTQEQKVLMSDMCSDVNSNMLLDSMVSGMQGMAAVELLGTYPAMEGLVPNFKEEMKKRMRHYIQSGAIQWEQGVQSQIADPIQRKNSADEKPYKQAILTLLRSDNAQAFGRFLYGIQRLNKFPAYELSRGDSNSQLMAAREADSVSVRALFRMSLMTSDYGWSAVGKDSAGEVSKSLILDHSTNPIARTHSLSDRDALAKNHPKYVSARTIASTGMGDALLRPIKYDMVDAFESNLGLVEGVHTKVIVPRRAAAISKPFVRKMMVDIMIREAKKAGTNKISLQPARMATLGRSVVSRGQITTAGKTGLSGPKGLLYDQGIRTIPLLGYSSPSPRMYTGATPTDTAANKYGEVAPYGQKASLGFAFKRLEDGRIVINISGDVLGYKNFTTLSSRGGWDRLAVGVNLEEALGYSISDKTIAHMDPKFLGNGMEPPSTSDVQIANMLGVHGGAWRAEILKKARSILSNGTHESRQVNQRIIGNTSLFSKDSAETLGRIAAGEGNPNSTADVMTAMALMRDCATDNYLTITLNAGSSQEAIKAAIFTLLMERNGVNRIMATLGHKRDTTNEFNVFASTLTFGTMNDDSVLMRNVMGESGMLPRGATDWGTKQAPRGSIHGVLEAHVQDMSSRSGATDDTTIKATGARQVAEMLIGNLPHLTADIEKLSAMAFGKDSGYFLPDLERQLAMNGDKRSAIEAIFPDRPELTEFAWDSASNSNVTIIPKKDGKKIIGYLVGYDIPSGVDKSSGRPVMSRKVTVVKTMSEAESLRNKFTLSTSKAELALAIDSLSNQTGKFAITSKDVTRGTYAPVRRNTKVKVSEGDKGSGMFELDYSNGSTYTVGDLDLRLSREQAQALEANLSVSDVLQTEIIEPRSANMMVGGTRSDAKELESLLRRKINFGTGMGRVEFSSRLMNVVAHGKTKGGKNKYPELMTGAEWYKFIRENAVSKDEIRMSGIAHLLYENKDMQISRSELAEFVFTMYPRNFRQDRGGPINDQQYLSRMTQSNGSDGFPKNSFIYPFIFDAEAKEVQVMDAHAANLNAIQNHLTELRNSGEEGNARANVIESVIKKSIDELVDLTGFPKEILDWETLAEKIKYIFTELELSKNHVHPEEYISGSSRRVRPAQMDYLIRSVIEAKMQEINGIVGNALEKDIGLVDPWNWAFSHTGDRYEQFELSGNGAEGARTRAERRPIVTAPKMGGPSDRLLIQQGVMTTTGNAHEGMATYRGSYSSSIWLTELWSKRMEAEHARFIGILEQRKLTATNPEDIRRIQSIIDAAERVKVMRSSFDAERGSQMGSAGHYGTPLTGTFQLGHIRTTAGAMTASHGIHTLGNGIGSVDESDPIVGVRREFEPAFMIEEIQSDTFQYQTFGETVLPEFSMPDSLEQAAGLKDVSIFQGLKKQIEDISSSLEATNISLLNHLNNIKQRNGPSANGPLTHGIQWKVLESTTALERWLLKRDLIDNNFPESTILLPTGGTAKLTPALVAKYGMTEIPTYKWNKEYYNDNSQVRDVSSALSKALFNASATAFQEICPKNFGVLDLAEQGLGGLITQGGHSENASPTPLFVLIQYAMMDDQAQMSASEMKRALLELSQPNFDYDAMAERTVVRIENAIRAWKNGDPSFRRFETGNNAVKIKVLEAYVETLREMQRSSRFTIPNFTYSINNGSSQDSSIIRAMADEPITFAGGNYVAYHWDEVKAKIGTHNTFIAHFNERRLNPSDIHEKREQGYTIRYRLTSEFANNALSQLLMDFSSVFAAQADVGDAPKRMEELRAKLEVMSKGMAVNTRDPNASMPHIITSQPYGIEDIYRPISMQGTILRAANAGYRQVGMTDARHHFVRGHGSESRPVLILGRKRRVFVNADGELGYPLRAIRMLGDEQYYALHGGFFDRLRKMEDVELKASLLGKKFEHNGIDANLITHLVHAIMDSKDFVELGQGNSALNVDNLARALREPEYMKARFSNINSALGIQGAEWIEKAFSEDGGNALLSDDGKPVAYRKGGTNWWSRGYGTLVSGEKTGTQRLMDAAAASIGQTYILAEYERGSGYINNYGLPMWYQRLNYAGQDAKNLTKTSTDSFERPVIERGEDGMYRVLDPKTAKLILQSDNPDMVREALLQNSKYLGSLPYLSGFLGEWKGVGGYVFSGYGYGHGSEYHSIAGGELGTGMPYTTNPFEGNDNVVDFTFNPSKGEVKDRRQVYMNQDPDVTTLAKDAGMSHSTSSRASKSWKQVPAAAEVQPIKLVTKLVFGLEPTDANVGKVLRLMNSNASTMFRFAPNFQTDAQRTAFRQKVIAGIPSMMVGGYGENGMPQANPTLLAWLETITANYEKAGKAAKAIHDAVQENLDYGTAGKRHGTNRKNVAAYASQLRKKGIPVPKQMSSSFGEAQRVINPKTGRYRITDEAIQLMEQMRNSGHTLKEIGETIGVSEKLVLYYLKREDDNYRPERADPTEPYGGPHA